MFGLMQNVFVELLIFQTTLLNELCILRGSKWTLKLTDPRFARWDYQSLISAVKFIICHAESIQSLYELSQRNGGILKENDLKSVF